MGMNHQKLWHCNWHHWHQPRRWTLCLVLVGWVLVGWMLPAPFSASLVPHFPIKVLWMYLTWQSLISTSALAPGGKQLIHWKIPWCWERLKAKEKGGSKKVRSFNSITDSIDMNLSKLLAIVEDRGTWHATHATPAHGGANSQTWLSEWTTTTMPS